MARASEQEVEAKAAAKKINDSAIEKLKELEVTVKRHEEELRRLAEVIGDEEDEVDDTQPEPYIISDKYQTWHRALDWFGKPPETWKTPCDWSYGASIFDRARAVPSDLAPSSRCPRCFPKKASLDSDASCD